MSSQVGEVPPIVKSIVTSLVEAMAESLIVPVLHEPAVTENGAESTLTPASFTSTVRVGVVPPDALAEAPAETKVELAGTLNLKAEAKVAVSCLVIVSGIV